MTTITRTPTGWLYRGARALQLAGAAWRLGDMLKAREVHGIVEIELRVKK